ncbi:DUF5789 family protein [Halopelagius longus]|uniref:DUF2795 domain-containing protein n=1 Tax=Halopelagius longus TaxID=1236180 RepID=A0A1H1AZZ0_9EURY|nr:hypothetical protein [Halopelagius longus]RDI70584.1 hypothetical protein DWB78_01950 [Halopelagius longus]SDQ45223.1 hypothetical protein SAMN05216278_1569 [Halopelagius longus]
MTENVKLSRVEPRLEELSYPISRSDAAAECSDVELQLADGEVNLGDVIADTGSESFGGSGELYEELQNALPMEALGDPRQSDGDA